MSNEVENLTPRSRMEAYLKNCCLACGCDGLPAPITTTDKLLYHLAQTVANAGGGASSWNDLKDKPFGEEKAFEPIVWDGNPEGLESVDAGGGLFYYKVSAEPLTDPASVDSLVVSVMNEPGTEIYKAEDVGVRVQPFGFSFGEYMMSITEDVSMNGFTFTRGVWLMSMNGTFFSGVNPKTTLKTLEEKYMPTLTSPSGKKFKLSVDDSGTISSVEVTV